MKPPLPKEHGAWGMLALPMVVALAWSGFTAAGLTAVVMVLAAYLVRAPLEALAAGRRDASSWRWLAGYGLTAALLGLGLLLAGRTAWLPVVLVLAPVLAVTLSFAARKQKREALNELLGAVALPASAPVVYAAATGRLDAGILSVWAAFAIYNAVTVPYVRTWVMARRAARSEAYQPTARATRRTAYAGLVATALGVVALALSGHWPWALTLAFVPALARIVAGLPKAGVVEVPIKRLGWIEMAHATLFALLVGFAGR